MIRHLLLLMMLVLGFSSASAQVNSSFWKRYCFEGIEECFPVLVVNERIRTILIPEVYRQYFSAEHIADFKKTADLGDGIILFRDPSVLRTMQFAATQTISKDDLSIFDSLADIPQEGWDLAGSIGSCIGSAAVCAGTAGLFGITAGISSFITVGACGWAGYQCTTMLRTYAIYKRYRAKQKAERNGAAPSGNFPSGVPGGSVPSGATMGRPANSNPGSVGTSIDGRDIGSSGVAGGGGQLPNINEEK